MIILLLNPYFKINGWIYRGILGVLVKKIIKSNFIPSNSSQFWRVKIWGFMEIERNECSLLLISFFFLLKLPNKEKEKYSKIVIFIPFYSIHSSQSRAKALCVLFPNLIEIN